ncbi:hypothetical protein FDP41_006414 [Naegleria fowleri]|uniref:GATA-type domain-containing protein n=1 Tax=Naegleria fowleri TaxID=5763 RepID=A0A6A5BHU0_NAEFO|nr:uncharacterized protein FDP41_006414 [Naegleria fowleri]KAF0974382.1 hypothetical protein FDP41_006414 [Naegleria fowleri]CAG4712989.1 unnamed protein product [Naegleria fowleri]
MNVSEKSERTSESSAPPLKPHEQNGGTHENDGAGNNHATTTTEASVASSIGSNIHSVHPVDSTTTSPVPSLLTTITTLPTISISATPPVATKQRANSSSTSSSTASSSSSSSLGGDQQLPLLSSNATTTPPTTATTTPRTTSLSLSLPTATSSTMKQQHAPTSIQEGLAGYIVSDSLTPTSEASSTISSTPTSLSSLVMAIPQPGEATSGSKPKKKKAGAKKASETVNPPLVPLTPGSDEYNEFVQTIKSKIVLPKKLCSSCGVNDTPTWRKGPLGLGTLCNACGIKYSTHSLTLDPQTGGREGYKSFVVLGDPSMKHSITAGSAEEDGSATPHTSEQQQHLDGDGNVLDASLDTSIKTETQVGENGSLSSSLPSDASQVTPEKKKRSRGRPKGSGNKKKLAEQQQQLLQQQQQMVIHMEDGVDVNSIPAQPVVTPKRGRGRPPSKHKQAAAAMTPVVVTQPEDTMDLSLDLNAFAEDEIHRTQSQQPKRRGRKRKNVIEEDSDYIPEDETHVNFVTTPVTIARGKGKSLLAALPPSEVSTIQPTPVATITTTQKKKKVVYFPTATETQLHLLAKQITSANIYGSPSSEQNCIYFSSEFLRQCIEGFGVLLKQKQKKNGDINKILTKDALTYIFLFLHQTDIVNLMLVCRYWCDIAKSEVIWKEIYRRNWGVNEESVASFTKSILARAPSIDWYEMVQARTNVRICSPIQQIEFMAKFYAIENKPKILACIQQNLNEEINERNSRKQQQL